MKFIPTPISRPDPQHLEHFGAGGHARLRAVPGNRDRGSCGREAAGLRHAETFGERDRERAVEGITGGRRIDGTDRMRGPRVRSVADEYRPACTPFHEHVARATR